MSAEADAVCGAGYGERSAGRCNTRNGYRQRDTRAGSIDLAIPKLRQGSYIPDWLLERRCRAEAGLCPGPVLPETAQLRRAALVGRVDSASGCPRATASRVLS